MDGHKAGWKEGHEAGLKAGLKEGREAGHKAGREEGHKEGLEEGLKQGLQEGMIKGELKKQMGDCPKIKKHGIINFCYSGIYRPIQRGDTAIIILYLLQS